MTKRAKKDVYKRQECMWLILQHDTPEDFVIATGAMHTVREFCTLAFREAGDVYKRQGPARSSSARAANATTPAPRPAKPSGKKVMK